MNDANDAVTLIRAFAAKVGQGHSTIAFDPGKDEWRIRFGMRIRGKPYSFTWGITVRDLSQMQYPDTTGEHLAETVRRQINAAIQNESEAMR